MSVLLLLCPLVDMFSVVTRLPDVGLGSVSCFFFLPPNSLLFNGSPLASTKLLLVFLGSKLTGEKYKNCHSTVSITQVQCSAV